MRHSCWRELGRHGYQLTGWLVQSPRARPAQAWWSWTMDCSTTRLAATSRCSASTRIICSATVAYSPQARSASRSALLSCAPTPLSPLPHLETMGTSHRSRPMHRVSRCCARRSGFSGTQCHSSEQPWCHSPKPLPPSLDCACCPSAGSRGRGAFLIPSVRSDATLWTNIHCQTTRRSARICSTGCAAPQNLTALSSLPRSRTLLASRKTTAEA
mmetsp:Transcript_50718/g.113987  ORF Transcript_50718/g.113987 Transcript_50718/m.113987 type:complete len:214 (-) Transcript_50718:715-1356(-)